MSCRMVLLALPLGSWLTLCTALQAQSPCGTVAEFTVLEAGQCADLPVSFDVDNPDPGLTYSWDFGDGTTDDAFQPDLVWPNTHQCDGPRQYCGTVNVLR